MALYLQHLGEQVKSKSAAEEAANTLVWVQGVAGVRSATRNPTVQEMLQGLKRTLGNAEETDNNKDDSKHC